LGLYRVQLEAGLGELWGHDGRGNSFAYYWPKREVTFTGTINQTEMTAGRWLKFLLRAKPEEPSEDQNQVGW
jgi:hypothetical protein